MVAPAATSPHVRHATPHAAAMRPCIQGSWHRTAHEGCAAPKPTPTPALVERCSTRGRGTKCASAAAVPCGARALDAQRLLSTQGLVVADAQQAVRAGYHLGESQAGVEAATANSGSSHTFEGHALGVKADHDLG